MLSIICPTYNRARFLRDCIVPFMELPVGAAEVLVVDDCSSDDTLHVCRELVHRYGDQRLRYFTLDYNQGAPEARNRGVAEARGQFVMFVDSDDVPLISGILDLLAELRSRDNVDYVYGKVLRANDKLEPLPEDLAVGSAWDGSSGEVAGYHWHTMGAIYRRSYLNHVGPWNRELVGSQDWEFQARVKVSGGRGRFLPVLVGYWRQHSESRVGATQFRPDYVQSVMKACASIIYHAEKAGMCDKSLQYRIARRLLVHAVAFGAEGNAKMKRVCLTQVAETAPDARKLQLIASLFKVTPHPIDLLTDLALRKIQNRP